MKITIDGIPIQKRWATKAAEKNTYSWNCDKNKICRNEEGALIPSFNAIIGYWDEKTKTYIDTGLEELPYFIEPSGGETAIKNIRRTPEDNAIYSISGQRVGTATYTNGRLCTDGLKPGLYIVGGKKVVVK